MVARTVIARDAGAISADHHRRAMQSDVEVLLIESPREERRVDRDHRPQPGKRHPRGGSHRVLFGNADVEEPIRIARLERQQTRGPWHRRSHADNSTVPLGVHEEGVRERLLITRSGLPLGNADRPTICRGAWSGNRIRRLQVVKALHFVRLSWRVALPFPGEDVQHYRPIPGRRVAECLLDRWNVVPVNWARVPDAQCLEKHVRLNQLTKCVSQVPERSPCQLADTWNLRYQLTDPVANSGVGR